MLVQVEKPSKHSVWDARPTDSIGPEVPTRDARLLHHAHHLALHLKSFLSSYCRTGGFAAEFWRIPDE